MSGWWVVGSVGEAAFFGVLFLLGIISLTIVVSGQVFWPESTILRPGFGFWLMVIASSSFMVIGLTAFVLQISQTLASPEMRSAMASKVKKDHLRRAEGLEPGGHVNLPSLRSLTDSPGIKLAYRLPEQRGESTPLILSALFTTAWDAAAAVLSVVTAQKYLSSGPSWFLSVLLVLFLSVAFFSTRWFFGLFRRRVGIGPTAVEIDQLPLLPGNEYRVYLCQYGRATFRSLHVALVAFEEATYQQGTDVRTESQETLRIEAQRLDTDRHADRPTVGGPASRIGSDRGNQTGFGGAQGPDEDGMPRGPSGEWSIEEPETVGSGLQTVETGETRAGAEETRFGDASSWEKLVAEPEKPLELDCRIRLPLDMMHSFQSEHSALVWKIVVSGECNKWPAFCRSFPVAVYPRSAV